MKKVLLLILGGLVAAVLAVYHFYGTNIERAAFAASWFTGAEQYENFNRVEQLFPVTTLSAAPQPHVFEEAERMSLPDSFLYKDADVDIQAFLSLTDTSALLVLKDGKIVFEQYFLTGGRDVRWLSMSVAKSFISAGIGIAVDEGLIDIQLPITDYVPELADSAYAGVAVKDILQMSSGAAWNEDYTDRLSDVNRLGIIMALGGSLDEFVATVEPDTEPGTLNHYNSADTQALGMLLARVTKTSVTQYLTDKLWHPLGMEYDAYWMIDSKDVEMAFVGLNATARDYAKLGELYRMNGMWEGQQVVSSDWVAQSTRPDAPHLMPGLNKDFPLGYGYQWWIPETSEGEYLAIGVYNQFIYVNPTNGVVIVKLSAYSDYATSDDETAYREMETVELMREIGRAAQ